VFAQMGFKGETKRVLSRDVKPNVYDMAAADCQLIDELLVLKGLAEGLRLNVLD